MLDDYSQELFSRCFLYIRSHKGWICCFFFFFLVHNGCVKLSNGKSYRKKKKKAFNHFNYGGFKEHRRNKVESIASGSASQPFCSVSPLMHAALFFYFYLTPNHFLSPSWIAGWHHKAQCNSFSLHSSFFFSRVFVMPRSAAAPSLQLSPAEWGCEGLCVGGWLSG